MGRGGECCLYKEGEPKACAVSWGPICEASGVVAEGMDYF